MKFFLTSVLLALLAITALSFNAAAQTDQDAEVARLNRELSVAFSAGKFDDALAAATKVVDLLSKLPNKNGLMIAKAVGNRGLVELAKGDEINAVKSLEQAVESLKDSADLSKADGSQLAIFLESLASLKTKTRLQDGVAYYELAVKWRERSDGPDATQLVKPLAALGNIKYWVREWNQAGNYYKRALLIALKGGTEFADDTKFTIYLRTKCSFRKSKTEAGFAELKALYDAAGNTPVPNWDPIPKDKVEGTMKGKALSLPAPYYTDEAKANRADGKVLIEVLINERGDVTFACAANGANQYLALPSEAAALKAKFAPTELKGSLVKVTGVVTYVFHL